MKAVKTITSRTLTGIHSRSERPSRCIRNCRELTRDGSGGGAAVARVGRAVAAEPSGIGTAIPDPWVENGVHQVREQVAEHGHQREDEHDSLNERHVVVLDAVE